MVLQYVPNHSDPKNKRGRFDDAFMVSMCVTCIHSSQPAVGRHGCAPYRHGLGTAWSARDIWCPWEGGREGRR